MRWWMRASMVCLVAPLLGGCGFLDQDLYKSQEEFEEGFEKRARRLGHIRGKGTGGGGSSRVAFGCGGVRVSSRRRGDHIDVSALASRVRWPSRIRLGASYYRAEGPRRARRSWVARAGWIAVETPDDDSDEESEGREES